MAPKTKNQEVELMALPAGCPEVIQVVCNNVFGHFVVRTRMVVDRNWQEHTVTDFVTACRKHHLTWKYHVHVAAVGGHAGLTMNEWLNGKGLNNSLLLELSQNAKKCGWERPRLSGEASRFVVSLKSNPRPAQANGHNEGSTDLGQSGMDRKSSIDQSEGGQTKSGRDLGADTDDNASEVRGGDTAVARERPKPAGQAAPAPCGKLRSPRRKQASLNSLSNTPSRTSNAPPAPARPQILDAAQECGGSQQSPRSALQAARSPAGPPVQLQADQRKPAGSGAPPPAQSQVPAGPASSAEVQTPAIQDAMPVASPEPWANLPVPEPFSCSPLSQLQQMHAALQLPASAAIPAAVLAASAASAAAAVQAAAVGANPLSPRGSGAGAQAADSPRQPPRRPQSSPGKDKPVCVATGSPKARSAAAAAAQPAAGAAESPAAPASQRGAGSGRNGAAAGRQPAAAAPDSAVFGLALQDALATVDGFVGNAQERSACNGQGPAQAAATTVASLVRQPQSAPAKAAPAPPSVQPGSTAAKPGSASAPIAPNGAEMCRSDARAAAEVPVAEPAPTEAARGGANRAQATPAAAAKEKQQFPTAVTKTSPPKNAAQNHVTSGVQNGGEALDPSVRTSTPATPAGMTGKANSGNINMDDTPSPAGLSRLKRSSTAANLETDFLGTFTKRFKAEAAARKAAVADKISAQRELAAVRAAMRTLEHDRDSAHADAKAIKEEEAAKEQRLAELQAQLTAAQEAAGAHKRQATAAKGELFALRTSSKKSEKALTEENAKLKAELASARSLNETIRSSSQHVRVQLETSKKATAAAEENARKEVQEAKQKEEAAVKALEAARQHEAEMKRELDGALSRAEQARKELETAKEKHLAATRELEASKLAAYKEKASTNAESMSLKAQLEAARKGEAKAKTHLDQVRKDADEKVATAAATAANEAQKARAAAVEIERLMAEVQNVHLQYHNSTNLHRETHAENLRLQCELAESLRKEATLQAEGAEAFAKYQNTVEQAKRQEELLNFQVGEANSMLVAAETAATAALAAKALAEEAAQRSSTEISALRSTYEAQLREAQQALEAEVADIREQLAKEYRAKIEQDLAAMLGDASDDDMGLAEEEHELGAQQNGDRHSDAGAGAGRKAAEAEAGACTGPADTSPNKASTCSGQTCHEQPSSAEQSPHFTPDRATGNAAPPPPVPPPPQLQPQPQASAQSAPGQDQRAPGPAGSGKEREASKAALGAAEGDAGSVHDDASHDSDSEVARRPAGQALPVGSPRGSGASKARKRGRPVKIVKSVPDAGAVCPPDAPGPKRQAASSSTGHSLTAHAKDLGVDVEQDAALLGALMRCKDARNENIRGGRAADPAPPNYSLADAVQHMRQMALLLHSPM